MRTTLKVSKTFRVVRQAGQQARGNTLHLPDARRVIFTYIESAAQPAHLTPGLNTMRTFFARFWQVTIHPDRFFEQVREEHRWRPVLLHWLVLAVLLSLGSVIAWGAGIPGDTPLNSALGTQMDVYPYWRDTLLPRFGAGAYPIAMAMIVLEMLVITLVYTPVIFLVFRYLGGAPEPNGLLHAFQGFTYGLTPALFGGFLPVLGLATGVYTTLLQLYRGPSITLRNRGLGAYLLVIAVLTYAIARYWQGSLL